MNDLASRATRDHERASGCSHLLRYFKRASFHSLLRFLICIIIIVRCPNLLVPNNLAAAYLISDANPWIIVGVILHPLYTAISLYASFKRKPVNAKLMERSK
jgi:hypothetical protein